MNRVKNIILFDHGVILMETLLTLPVYVVTLVGIFWMGEIALARLALTSGERLSLWEHSNRHLNSILASQDVFYFLPQQTTRRPELITGSSANTNSFPSTLTARNWGKQVRGRMDLYTRRSAWSWESTNFINTQLWNENTHIAGQNRELMYARSDAADNPLNSTILAVADNDAGRANNVSYNSSRNWDAIYRATWNGFIAADDFEAAINTPHSISTAQWHTNFNNRYSQ